MRILFLPLVLLLVGCTTRDDDDTADDDHAAVNDDDAAEDEDTAGPPDLEALNAALRENELIAACFATAEAAGVTLGNRILLNLVVEPDGSVSTASIITPEHQDTDLDTCISTVVLDLAFDPWKGEPATINYTFFF